MILLSDLLAGRDATRMSDRDWTVACPKCGGKVSIKSFGRGWSARCESCGKLGEEDFAEGTLATFPSSLSTSKGVHEGDSTIARPRSAAQPAQEEVRQHRTGPAQVAPAGNNATPAAGSNGAGGGRSYHGRPKTQPDKALVPSRGNSAAAPVDDILKRKPPQDIEAEMSVLGAVFLENECVATAQKTLDIDDFYREAHREIFRGMVNLRHDGIGIDQVTLGAELRRRDLLEAIGGMGYLAELAVFVPTWRNTPHYAGIVKAMAIKRHIASQATMLASLAYDGVSAEALIGEMERLLKPIAEGNRAVVPFPEPLTASQWYAKEAELYSRVTWVWDNILEGGGISVLAGKKGAGKSTFVRTLMLAAARGWALLGRNMQASRVWYIDMEPGGSARKALMEQLGWNDDDQLHISTGSPMAGKPGLFEWLKAKIVANRYQMVVVDTMYKLLKIEGTNDYDKGIYGQVPIEEICRETGCHFMLIHHARKNPSPGALSSIAEEILGSVSVAATAGTVMLIRKRADVGTFQMDPPRYGEAIEGEMVLKKLENGWVEGAGSYGNQWVGWAKQAVFAAIAERGADWSKAEDIEVIDVAKGGPMTVKSKKWLLGKLVDDKTVERSGEGVRGDPFRYRKATLQTVPQEDSRYKEN